MTLLGIIGFLIFERVITILTDLVNRPNDTPEQRVSSFFFFFFLFNLCNTHTRLHSYRMLWLLLPKHDYGECKQTPV